MSRARAGLFLAAWMSTGLLVGLGLCLSSALAAEPTGRPPRAPEPPRAADPLQDLYRELYRLQIELARTEDAAVRDSLQSSRRELLDEIRDLQSRRWEEESQKAIEEVDRSQDEIRQRRQLEQELDRLGENVDWEELSAVLDRSLQDLGQGLGKLGEQLEQLELEIGPQRIELGNRETGDRVTVVIPKELRESLTEGIGALGQELGRVLADTTDNQWKEMLADLERGLPRESRRIRDLLGRPREPQRRVVAKSVFRFRQDFELAEDEIVQGDVFLVGGDGYIAGEVQGAVVVLVGDLLIEETGEVGKDAVSVGGAVRRDSGSVVRGSLFDISQVAPGLLSTGWGGGGGVALLVHLLRIFVLALLLFLCYALMRRRIQGMSTHILASPARNLLLGILWFSVALGAFVVSSVGLAITVIGIPVVIVLVVVFAGLSFLAYFVACDALGNRVLELVGVSRARGDWVAGLGGLGVLEIPALMAVSLAGVDSLAQSTLALHLLDYGLKFLALCLGFGSAVATRAGVRLSEPANAGSGASAS